MATFVQATTGFNGSGSNQNLFTSNFGVACTAGNSLIVGVCVDAANATLSAITDNASVPNTYTLLGSVTASTLTILLYVAQNITANGGSVYQVQATDSFLDGQIFAQEWSGIPTTGNILDNLRKDSGTSTSPTIGGSVVADYTNELIVSILMLQSQTNTYTAGTGFSNLSNVASSFTSAGIESQAQVAMGPYIANFGMTNTGINFVMLTAGIKTTASDGTGVDSDGAYGQRVVTQSGMSSVGGIH